MARPASAAGAALFRALAVALVAMALQLSAAAAAAPRGPSIGLPGCDTTCGNVSVPYPFGISRDCYWPGFYLKCDRSKGTPRLLLGDGTLRVTNISLKDTTVRVMRSGTIIKGAAGSSSISEGGWTNASFGRGFTEYGYLLAGENELVVLGCDVVAMLLADGAGVKAPGSIAGCSSLCSKTYISSSDFFIDMVSVLGPPWGQCTGTSGCCQSNVTTVANPPSRVLAKRLYTGINETDEEEEKQLPVNVFVAETGWIQQQRFYDDEEQWQRFLKDEEEIPFLLSWSVTQGDVRPRPQNVLDGDYDGMPCKEDVRRKLCKSEHSGCWNAYQAPGYTCQCEDGYDGNPYLAGPGGCQDIDECKLPIDVTGCFGDCINTNGSMECRCPFGTFGNPGARGGCVKIKSTRVESRPTVAPLPLGRPTNCETTCGDVKVPYPFGIGPAAAGCSLPGFNLTCNRTSQPPRLLLDSNGTLEVVNISLADSTVHVIHHARMLSNPTTIISTTVFYDIPPIGEPYTLSTRNELIFYGCNVQAILYGENRNSTESISSKCSSTCSSERNYVSILSKDETIANTTTTTGALVRRHTNGGYCSGRDDGCCYAPIAAGSTTPTRMKMKFKGLQSTLPENYDYAVAFISEEGLTNQWGMILNITNLSVFKTNYTVSPLALRWAVKQEDSTALPGNSSGQFCRQENGGGFTCHCNTGYEGNPYIDGGCKDIDECSMAVSGQICYAKCINFPGGHKCRCPRGYHGNPYKSGGCSPTGLIIGVVIGPTLLLSVLGIIVLLRWMKQHKAKVLKQKYFKQNRGHLLQQLVSQEADIAERMIISVDELAKATNNFDKARELGGGGHGTVYKGILSNLGVVAIKKPKTTVQKKIDQEIDEFINEVAILSQINHRNVVKLFGCCLETEVPLLVYEFISNGTLYHHLHNKGPRSLSWSNRLRIATEVATSLAYLHSAVSIPIIHRDIKSANILLDDTLTSKVADFGASRYIPIEKTGLTTRVQGTIGYLDPMYFSTGRLNEKSDVYSFGVILIELVTRKKPFSYSEGGGLAAHLVDLFIARNLVQIIDPQVMEEGGQEVQEVAALATSCVNLRAEGRPTMRQVEHTLEGLWGSKKYKRDDTVAPEFKDGSIVTNCPSSTEGGQGFQESSRRYSLEQEMMLSSRYPR